MEHTKKLVLISRESLELLQNKSKNYYGPEQQFDTNLSLAGGKVNDSDCKLQNQQSDASLSRLYNEMHGVLKSKKNKELDDRDKLIMYHQHLQRYLNIKDLKKKRTIALMKA